MSISEISCELRSDLGTAHARRARREGRIPSILYGSGKEVLHLWLSEKDARRIVGEQMHVLSVRIEGKPVQTLVKDIQYDTFGDIVLHIDFQRLRKGERVEAHLALVLKGEPVGAKEGGVLEQHLHRVTLVVDPVLLPPRLECDVSGLHIGARLRASDIPIPEGAELKGDAGALVASVVKPMEEEEEEPIEETKEPEVTGKGKAKTEEEE